MPKRVFHNPKPILSAFPRQYSPNDLKSSISSDVYCAWLDNLYKTGNGRKKMLTYLKLALPLLKVYEEWLSW